MRHSKSLEKNFHHESSATHIGNTGFVPRGRANPPHYSPCFLRRCSAGEDVELILNGKSNHSRFCFDMFKWKNSIGVIYLHCYVNVCNKSAYPDECGCARNRNKRYGTIEGTGSYTISLLFRFKTAIFSVSIYLPLSRNEHQLIQFDVASGTPMFDETSPRIKHCLLETKYSLYSKKVLSKSSHECLSLTLTNQGTHQKTYNVIFLIW